MCFAMLFMCVCAALAQTKISGTVVAAEDNELLSVLPLWSWAPSRVQ